MRRQRRGGEKKIIDKGGFKIIYYSLFLGGAGLRAPFIGNM
jgi:hypothetical protein